LGFGVALRRGGSRTTSNGDAGRVFGGGGETREGDGEKSLRPESGHQADPCLDSIGQHVIGKLPTKNYSNRGQNQVAMVHGIFSFGEYSQQIVYLPAFAVAFFAGIADLAFGSIVVVALMIRSEPSR
jgi:hypothetical protein